MKKKNLFSVLILAVCFVFVLTLVGCNKTQTDKPDTDKPVVAEKFTITFDSDGGTEVAAVTVEKGKTITAPDEPTKEGYTFAGWYLGDSATAYEFTTIPTANITLTAKWTANTYAVTLNKDGGDCADLTSYTYGVGATLPTPTKTGYTFGGWYESAELSGEAVTVITATDTGDKTYYAKWTINTYTVTYDLQDGEFADGSTEVSFSVTFGENFTLKKAKKTGYTFGGWFYNDDEIKDGVWNIDASVVLKARYTALNENEFAVTLNANGGTCADLTSYTYGVGATLPTPTKTGYTFGGWFASAELSGEAVTEITATDTGAKTYYAKWTANKYAVILNKDDGDCDDIASYTYGVGATLPIPSKTGYTFDGWFESAELSGEAVTEITATDTGVKTYYAKWTANKYTVTFNSNGGTTISNKVVTYNENYGVLPVPEKEGYTFDGWFTDDTYAEQIFDNGIYPIAEDITIYAKWTKKGDIPYTVRHWQANIGADGSLQNTENYTLADTDNLTGAKDCDVTPSVKNYEGFTSPATQTITIAADGSNAVDYYYTRNSYSVTLNAEEGITNLSGDGTYEYGQSVTVSATADAGYTFNDIWTGDFTTATFTMPAHNVTMTAVATANKYTITFFGVNYETEEIFEILPAAEVTFNEMYTLPEPPEEEYMTFEGWFELIDGEPSGEEPMPETFLYELPDNLSLVALHYPTKYYITYELDGGINNPENRSKYSIDNFDSPDGALPLYGLEDMIVKKEIGADLGGNSYEVSITSRSFEGWYKDSGFTEQVTDITLSLGTVTLYAKWSEPTTSTTTASKYQRIDANGTENASGEYILFGEYPQTKVTDEAVISALGDYANNEWTSYGYYRNKEISNFMEYTDKVYNGAQYRGVYFTEYRPNSCVGTFVAGQQNNGYITSTVYWFKYEPIKWRILNEAEGKALILCDMVIDSQQYDYKNDGSYKNNYEESTIRTWLNETFYNTAFSDMQKALIQTTTVDNSVESTGYEENLNACANTSDNVFLLSYADVTNSAYGFNGDGSVKDNARIKTASDYAQAQGCYVTYEGNCDWRLRSPDDNSKRDARFVADGGDCSGVTDVRKTDRGVVPALTISLS